MTNQKFKVRDRVKVISLKDYEALNVNYDKKYFNEVGTIHEIHNDCYYPYIIKFDNIDNCGYAWCDNNLELVNE